MTKTIYAYSGEPILVDDANYDELSTRSRVVKKCRHTYYAAWLNHQNSNWSPGLPFRVLMHRVILEIEHSRRPIVDHKDGNGLNNQKSNLRIATYSDNAWNRQKNIRGTSQYKGVCWYPKYGKWLAQIRANKRRYHLGYFDSEEEAYDAYCSAAARLHGEFARIP